MSQPTRWTRSRPTQAMFRSCEHARRDFMIDVSCSHSFNNTSLDSSSGTLICPLHVGRNNYVGQPLFGVDPIEWRLTRYYVIRDVIVIFEC